MTQPVDLLILLGLENSLDNLSTTQHCLLEYTVVITTGLVIGGLFALADFGIFRPKWLRNIQKKPPPIDEYGNVVFVATRNVFVYFLFIPFFSLVKDYVGYNTAPPISWFEIVWDFLKFLVPFSTWFYL